MTIKEALFAQAIFDIQKAYLPSPTKEKATEIAMRPSPTNPSRPRWHDFIAPELLPLLKEPT